MGNEGNLDSRHEMWAEWGVSVKAKSAALILRDGPEGGIELRSLVLI